MHPRVVGLTGGIASGKSTVARAFATLGVPVVDADQLAREVVEKGSPALADILAAFGPEVLANDGNLDRKALGARVFGNPEGLRTLNAITHPRIAALSAQRIQAALAQGAPYVVYEAALIVENGLYRGMAALVVVSVSPEVQLARMMKRDGFTEVEARARLRSQAPLETKLAAADFIIDNSGPEQAIAARVGEVHAALLAKVSVS
jgi:dephospho-CoA kinase